MEILQKTSWEHRAPRYYHVDCRWTRCLPTGVRAVYGDSVKLTYSDHCVPNAPRTR
jgi:hypothetical protein